MKKGKNLFTIVGIILVAAALIVASVIILFNVNKNGKIDSTHFELLKMSKISQIEQYVSKNKLDLQSDEQKTIVLIEKLKISKQNVDFYFVADTENTDYVNKLEGSCEIKLKKNDISSLKETTDNICKYLTAFFELDYLPNYSIYHNDGYEIEKTDESYAEILKGNAKISITAVDESSFWLFTFSKNETDSFVLEFFRSFDKDFYENGQENIILY